jgi:hypothetical protein
LEFDSRPIRIGLEMNVGLKVKCIWIAWDAITQPTKEHLMLTARVLVPLEVALEIVPTKGDPHSPHELSAIVAEDRDRQNSSDKKILPVDDTPVGVEAGGLSLSFV